ncbi:MAG: TonB-dependent receptor [Bacteroidales bacterium]|nr:TonB-dependent receptor [Bacteroidales bacterium]
MKHFVLPFLLLFPLLSIHAQADTVHLDDVTISVTPFEQRLSESTGSLSIIRPLPTDALSTINIADELNTAPGVFMASGTHTTNRLTIRGVGSRTPYSSNRIRAYLEEIPLTNGDGISTVEDLDMLGISRIEILKGPASAMYGSGLGGVVKMKASYPFENGFSYGASATAGSFNTQKYGLHAGWKKDHTAITLGVGRSSSDGFRENNRYNRNNLFLHGKTGTTGNMFTFHLLVTDLYSQIPSSLNAADFSENPEKAAANWLAIEGYEAYEKVTAGAGWKHQLSDRWENHLTVFSAWQDPYESRPFNILDEVSFTFGLRDYIQYRTNRLNIQAGIELFAENYQWEIVETFSGTPGALQLHNSEIRRYGNLFSHARWTPAPGLNIEAGINFNLLEYRLSTIYHIDGDDQSGKYGYPPVVSPRFGLNYNIAGDHYLHASAGHGFSAPSLEETLLPEGMVNPDLLPETGWNTDLGFRGWTPNDRWYYDVALYAIFIQNMLVTERVTEEIFTGINAGSARLAGIEIFNRFDITPTGQKDNWEHTLTSSIFLNSNKFTSFIDDGTDYSGNELPGIPAQVIHTRLRTSFRESLSVVLEWNWSGSQYLDDANTESYSGHMLVNARGSFRIASRKMPFSILLNGGINNLFDAAYASMVLVNAPFFGGAAPRYYYPGMPRHAFIGISIGH